MTMWYKYQFEDLNGNPVEDNAGSTGSIQPDKMKGWQIKAKEMQLKAKHGVKCIVKFKGLQS